MLLPETFGFDEVGILFYEKTSDSLYRLEAGGPDLRKVTLSTENVVRLPYNIGLTGQAIKTGHALIFNKGDTEPGYTPDIDNLHNIQGVKNILICPFFDKDGDPTELRGVIQLLNKHGPEPISQKDKIEASSICPAISQVLNLCALTKEVTDVSAGLARTMNDVRNYFGDQAQEFDYNL